MIEQGDIYWIDLGEPDGSEPGYRHPHVVVQNKVFNASRIQAVVVCALTSNLKRAGVHGNVMLDDGESGPPRQSVVNVSQIFTVDRSDLVEKIGSLSPRRVQQVIEGIKLVIEPREVG